MAQDAGVTGDAELGATKQALIANIVQRELAAAAMIPKTITDVSMFAVKGAKSISFPKAGSFTVNNRATGTKGTKQTLTFANDTMLLDQNAYVGWLVDSTDELQSTVEVQSEYIKRASTAHARNLDAVILGKISAAAGDSSQTGDVTEAKILAMRAYLLGKNANLADLTLVVSVAQEQIMLNIDKFIRADAYGSSNIPAGVIGKLYGVPVMVHNALPAGFNALMYEKSAACYGFQKGPAYDEQKSIEYGVGSKLCAVDQLFGAQALQIAQESAGAGKSPLISALIPAA